MSGMSLPKVVAIAPNGCIIVYDFVGLENNMDCEGARDITHNGLRRCRGKR